MNQLKAIRTQHAARLKQEARDGVKGQGRRWRGRSKLPEGQPGRHAHRLAPSPGLQVAFCEVQHAMLCLMVHGKTQLELPKKGKARAKMMPRTGENSFQALAARVFKEDVLRDICGPHGKLAPSASMDGFSIVFRVGNDAYLAKQKRIKQKAKQGQRRTASGAIRDDEVDDDEEGDAALESFVRGCRMKLKQKAALMGDLVRLPAHLRASQPA
jgi:hypothetical protein